MADNYAFTPGAGASARSKNPTGTLHIPVVYVSTTPATIVTGNQTISVGTAADSSLTVPAGATHALITVDAGGGDLRYWEDGSSPSTTQGLLVQAGGAAELTNLSLVRMRATTGTAAVNVSYRRYDQ